LSGTENAGQTARGQGGDAGKAENKAGGNLSVYELRASLRGDLNAILAEFEAMPDAQISPTEGVSEENAPVPRGKKRSKIIPVISEVLFYAVLAAFILGVFLFRSADDGAPRDAFGFSAMLMLTGSMRSEMPEDSLIITRRVDPQAIQMGDDISFLMGPEFVVTHRVVGIIEDFANTGTRGFETKGIENARPDREIVPAANVIGKVIFHSEYTGKAVLLIRQHFILVIVIFVLIIVFITVMRYLFKTRGA